MATPEKNAALRAREAVRVAYANATGRWKDADWTHPLTVEGKRFTSPTGKEVFCVGGIADCDICSNAETDAGGAELAAEMALAHLEKGDLPAAQNAAAYAVWFEKQYGDAPVWRPFLRAIEEALEADEAYRESRTPP